MLNGISSFFFGSAMEKVDGTQEVRLRVTSVDDEWALVDRTRGRSQSPLSNPMENLLIEHPSMSVYNTRGRPNSTGSGGSASDENSPMNSSRTLSVRSSPRHPRAMSTRAGLIPQRELVKSLQKTTRKIASKHHTRNHLERQNKAYNLRSLDRHQVRVQQPKKNC